MADKDVNKILNSKGYKYFKQNESIDELNYYNPYRQGDPYSSVFVKGIPMLFVTTPVMNFTANNINQHPFFQYLYENNHGILKLLNYGGFGGGSLGNGPINYFSQSGFIRLLTNKFVSIDLRDTESVSQNIGQTPYGYRMSLPGPNIESVNASQVSATFQETSDVAILKLFKAWADYIELEGRGFVLPAPLVKARKMLDYTSSLYYFLLDFDGETIKYYAKYTGCSPINVPYSSFAQSAGDSHGDPVQLPINFNYAYKEDMTPEILSDFNMVMSDDPMITSGITPDKDSFWIYDSAGDKGINLVNPYEELDMNGLTRAGVFLEGYKDNPTKKRYKLKFVNGSKVSQSSPVKTGDGSNKHW